MKGSWAAVAPYSSVRNHFMQCVCVCVLEHWLTGLRLRQAVNSTVNVQHTWFAGACSLMLSSLDTSNLGVWVTHLLTSDTHPAQLRAWKRKVKF
jgi:hypothetical protein